MLGGWFDGVKTLEDNKIVAIVLTYIQLGIYIERTKQRNSKFKFFMKFVIFDPFDPLWPA